MSTLESRFSTILQRTQRLAAARGELVGQTEGPAAEEPDDPEAARIGNIMDRTRAIDAKRIVDDPTETPQRKVNAAGFLRDRLRRQAETIEALKPKPEPLSVQAERAFTEGAGVPSTEFNRIAAERAALEANGADTSAMSDAYLLGELNRRDASPGGRGYFEEAPAQPEKPSNLRDFGRQAGPGAFRNAMGMVAQTAGSVADVAGFPEAAEGFRDQAEITQAMTPAPETLGGKAGAIVGSVAPAAVALAAPEAAPAVLTHFGVQGYGAAEQRYRTRAQERGETPNRFTGAAAGLAGAAAEILGEKIGLDIIGRIGAQQAKATIALIREGRRADALRILTAAVESAGVNGAEEAATQILNNVAAKGLYDPEQDIGEGVSESAIAGAVGGPVLGAAKAGADIAGAAFRSVQSKVNAAVGGRVVNDAAAPPAPDESGRIGVKVRDGKQRPGQQKEPPAPTAKGAPPIVVDDVRSVEVPPGRLPPGENRNVEAPNAPGVVVDEAEQGTVGEVDGAREQGKSPALRAQEIRTLLDSSPDITQEERNRLVEEWAEAEAQVEEPADTAPLFPATGEQQAQRPAESGTPTPAQPAQRDDNAGVPVNQQPEGARGVASPGVQPGEVLQPDAVEGGRVVDQGRGHTEDDTAGVVEYAKLGRGHARLARNLQHLVTSETITPEGRDVILEAFRDADTEHLFNRATVRSASNIGKLKETGGSPLGVSMGSKRPGKDAARIQAAAFIDRGVMKARDQAAAQGARADSFYRRADADPVVGVLHELGHNFMRTMATEQDIQTVVDDFNSRTPEERVAFLTEGLSTGQRSKVTKYFAATPSEWLAQTFAEYVLTNRVPDEKMRPLLKRLGDLFRKAIERLRNRRQLSPAMTELFEKLRTGRTTTTAGKPADGDTDGVQGQSREGEQAQQAGEAQPVRPGGREAQGNEKPKEVGPKREQLPELVGLGSSTEVVLPDGRELRAWYQVVDADALLPSHDARAGFKKNPGGDINERPYDDPTEGKASRATVERIATDPNPKILLATGPTATDGPPVVTETGVVLGGNARTMGMQLIYKRGGPAATKLRNAVQAAADRFGFFKSDIENMSSPVLVRRLDPRDQGEPGELSRILNQPLTTGKTRATESVSRGSKIDEAAAREIAGALGDGTLAETLADGKRAARVLRALRGSDVFSEQDLVGMMQGGELTPAAKGQIEDALLGAAVGDVRTLVETPPSVRASIVRSLPSIVRLNRTATAGGDPRFKADLAAALMGMSELRQSEARSVDDLLSQTTLTPQPWRDNPRAVALMRALDADKPTQLAKRFAKLAAAVDDAQSGQSRLIGGMQSVDEAFAEIFEDLGSSGRDGGASGEPLFGPGEDLDEAAIIDRAKKRFGTTKDPREAGYVLPDGSMLDFSGRHDPDANPAGYEVGGKRSIDHADLGDIVPEGEPHQRRRAFQRTGAVRVDFGAGIVEAGAPLTEAQIKTIARGFQKEPQAPHRYFEAIDPETGRRLAVESMQGPVMMRETVQALMNVSDAAEARASRNLFGPSADEEALERNRVDQLGFFSRVRDFIAAKVKGPQTGKQLLASFQNAGLPMDELVWSGLYDRLQRDADEKIDPEELQTFMQANGVQLEQTTLGGKTEGNEMAEAVERSDAARRIMRTTVRNLLASPKVGEADRQHEIERAIADTEGHGTLLTGKRAAEAYAGGLIARYGVTIPDLRERLEQSDFIGRYTEAMDAYAHMRGVRLATRPARATYEEYTLPGGDNYRELLLKLPRGYYWTMENKESGGQRGVWDTEEEAQAALDARKDADDWRLRAIEGGAQEYRSPHFNDRNIVAHIRVKDRTTPDGKRVLFAEEIQSDWHQAGRDRGYAPSIAERKKIDEELADVVAEAARAKEYSDETHERIHQLYREESEKHGKQWTPKLMAQPHVQWTDEENAAYKRDYARLDALSKVLTVKMGHKNEALHEANREALGDLFPKVEELVREHDNANAEYRDLSDREELLRARYETGKPPAGPFAKTWHEMAFRRLARLAAEGGYDYIGWTTGRQQGERYQTALATRVIGVAWDRHAERLYAHVRGEADYRQAPIARNVNERNLAEYVGQDTANRLKSAVTIGSNEDPTPDNQPPNTSAVRVDEIDIGTDGMSTFYDEILPRYAAKLGKKFDAKPARGQVMIGGDVELANEGGKGTAIEPDYADDVHLLPITPAMQKSVMDQGLPLFGPAAPDADDPAKPAGRGFPEHLEFDKETGIPPRVDAPELVNELAAFEATRAEAVGTTYLTRLAAQNLGRADTFLKSVATEIERGGVKQADQMAAAAETKRRADDAAAQSVAERLKGNDEEAKRLEKLADRLRDISSARPHARRDAGRTIRAFASKLGAGYARLAQRYENRDVGAATAAMKGLSPEERRDVGRIGLGFLKPADASEKVRDAAAKVQTVMDKGEAGLEAAAAVGLKRRSSRGRYFKLRGSGLWMPQALNAKGRAVLKDMGKAGRESPKLNALVDEMAAERPDESREELLAELFDFFDSMSRGTNRYFERTRVLLPEDYIELDPSKSIPSVIRKNAKTVAAGRIFGGYDDTNNLPEVDDAIVTMKEYNPDAADRFQKYIGHELGKPASPANRRARRVAGNITGIQNVTKLSTIFGPIRNAAQPWINTADYGLMPRLKAYFWDYPLLAGRATPRGRRAADVAERAGSTAGAGTAGRSNLMGDEDTDLPTKGLRGLQTAALYFFRASQRATEIRADAIARNAAEKALRDLAALERPGFGVRKLLTRAANGFGKARSRGAIERRMRRLGMTPARLAEAVIQFNNGGTRLSAEELDLAGWHLAHDTQFTLTVASKPLYYENHPLLRVPMQYKGFGLRQTGLMVERGFKEAARGNFVPLMQFTFAGLVAGELLALLRDWLKGEDKAITKTLRREGDAPKAKEAAERAATHLLKGGLLGAAGETEFGLGSYLGGPLLGTAEDTGRALVDVAKRPDVGQATMAAQRLAERQIPAVNQVSGAVRQALQTEGTKRAVAVAKLRAMGARKKTTAQLLEQRLFGPERYSSGPNSLTYQFAARAISSGDVDEAREYMTDLLDGLDADGVERAVRGLRASMNASSPLGGMSKVAAEELLRGLSRDAAAAARQLDREWKRDYNRALMDALRTTRQRSRQP